MYFIPQNTIKGSANERDSKTVSSLQGDPFKTLVVPRPIGWISTVSQDGITNLAPYSYFNAVSDNPHMVMFSSGGHKDSVTNIIQTQDFVCNYVSPEFQEAMNVSAGNFPAEVDEMEEAGLTAQSSNMIKAPRVKGCWAALECRLWKIIDLPGYAENQDGYKLVIGHVVCIYVKDEFIVDGKIDIGKAPPLARMGYADYIYAETLFEMKRPK